MRACKPAKLDDCWCGACQINSTECVTPTDVLQMCGAQSITAACTCSSHHRCHSHDQEHVPVCWLNALVAVLVQCYQGQPCRATTHGQGAAGQCGKGYAAGTTAEGAEREASVRATASLCFLAVNVSSLAMSVHSSRHHTCEYTQNLASTFRFEWMLLPGQSHTTVNLHERATP